MYLEKKLPDGDIHNKIVLKDESIVNDLPNKNIEFLYSYVKLYLPPKMYDKIKTISRYW